MSHSVNRSSLPWLFSGPLDLFAFAGSTLIAILLLIVGAVFGWIDQDTPGWTWVVAILLIDVAHVYATGFRVYFDRSELARRPWLYGLTPLLAFAISWAVYSESVSLFWRCLAYLAVFHFVRQQYGWVALYRRRAGETDGGGYWIDTVTIYSATLYPLAYWHCHLPREFWWFRDEDFLTIQDFALDTIAAPIFWVAIGLYTAKTVWLGISKKHFNPGKDIVVFSTALCWYLGIITFNSDFAFTVTNVIIHGIPYMVLVYWYHRRGTDEQSTRPTLSRNTARIARFVGLLWLLAYAEELIWDRGVWHQRDWLFGSAWDLGALEAVLVPLLAVPQITHYVLDGFIWKRHSHKRVEALASGRPAEPQEDGR
ncbi:MAG: hypothetical protein AAFU85_01850 [Planctomycetota bacterium]